MSWTRRWRVCSRTFIWSWDRGSMVVVWLIGVWISVFVGLRLKRERKVFAERKIFENENEVTDEALDFPETLKINKGNRSRGTYP